jgi:D-xylose transport system substrate-binding protein
MERWRKDEKIIMDTAAELGASVVSYSASENAVLQNEQAENLIIQGVDVLIVIPYDSEGAAEIIPAAHAAGIPVIAYDRLINNCDLDYYISFDNEKVGEYQARHVVDRLDSSRRNRVAYIGGSDKDNNSHMFRKGSMTVLQAAVSNGWLEIVGETFTEDWSAQNAYADMKRILEKHPDVDGVVAANDTTASGVIQALEDVSLAGKVPVSGQDAELGACRRIIKGTQTVTVYKPLSKLGRAAVELAVALARGAPVNVASTVFNGKKDVPSMLLESVAVTRENMEETVIQDGFHTHQEVYEGDHEKTE